jgi:anti-sigma regulatory factor (Ser/Thr protein kinase)
MPDGMAASLRTQTVLSMDLGTALIDRLEAADCTVGPLAGLALHEMVVNAAIHGNLQINTGRAAGWSDLAAREQLIAAALKDNVSAARLVTVALGWDAERVCAFIIDQGAGYEIPALYGQGPDQVRRAAGRGMIIARAVAHVDVQRGGRCTRLIFARAPAAEA